MKYEDIARHPEILEYYRRGCANLDALIIPSPIQSLSLRRRREYGMPLDTVLKKSN